MATTVNINEIFELTKFRANKNGYLGTISPDNFNLLFPRASIRFYNKLYAGYAANERVSNSISPFKSDPLVITIDNTGKFQSPCDFYYVDTLMFASPCTPYQPIPIERVESQRLPGHLSSSYEAPDFEFPIYGEYDGYLQFYPTNIGQATLVYLKAPVTPFWAYTLNGSVGTLGTLTGGASYVNGSYTNVPLTGGAGNGALANITVAGGIVTVVTITTTGVGYKAGDSLSTSNSFLGGAGTGFHVIVSTITNARQVYDAANSVDCSFQENDVDSIIYLLLQDLGISFRDGELESWAVNQSKTQE